MFEGSPRVAHKGGPSLCTFQFSVLNSFNDVPVGFEVAILEICGISQSCLVKGIYIASDTFVQYEF